RPRGRRREGRGLQGVDPEPGGRRGLPRHSDGGGRLVVDLRGAAYIVGAYEHPERKIDDRSAAQIHHEVAAAALADAGLGFDDVDAYLCAGDAPDGAGGFGPLSMVQYLGLHCTLLDSTEIGGSSYVAHVAHATAAIAAGRCSVALISQGSSTFGGG